MAITSPVRKALRTQFHTLWYRARQRKGLRVFALGQRLRHFADHVATTAGVANGERVRRWFQDKKVGWYTVLIPYQRRAQHAGQCGVEVEGGHVPTQDWMLNLQGCRSHIDVRTLKPSAPGYAGACEGRLTGHRHSGRRVLSHAPLLPEGSPYASIAEPCPFVQ